METRKKTKKNKTVTFNPKESIIPTTQFPPSEVDEVSLFIDNLTRSISENRDAVFNRRFKVINDSISFIEDEIKELRRGKSKQFTFYYNGKELEFKIERDHTGVFALHLPLRASDRESALEFRHVTERVFTRNQWEKILSPSSLQQHFEQVSTEYHAILSQVEFFLKADIVSQYHADLEKCKYDLERFKIDSLDKEDPDVDLIDYETKLIRFEKAVNHVKKYMESKNSRTIVWLEKFDTYKNKLDEDISKGLKTNNTFSGFFAKCVSARQKPLKSNVANKLYNFITKGEQFTLDTDEISATLNGNLKGLFDEASELNIKLPEQVLVGRAESRKIFGKFGRKS